MGPMTEPRPFRIDVPDAVLTDLRERLARTRWPEPIPGTEWDYGAKVDTVRDLCEYWRDGYDWRAAEADLNAVPGFLCEVDGVDLHYWHVRGRAPDAFPLLLIHGWPGSIYEFRELLGPLSEQFDLVVPALPGFGFGGKPRERGWGVTRIAAAFDALMSRLGYERYGVQGGDWGGIIAAKLGAAYPERVAGIHVNYVIAPPPPDAGPEHADAVEQYRLWRTYEDAYSRLQRTKPDSLTVGQADSPAGLAAWILEKFRTWSDCDGDVDRLLRARHAAHQPHVLLGARERRERRAHLLRERARPGRARPARPRRGAGRLRRVPARDHLAAARVGRGPLRDRALDRDAARRPLRGARGARSCSSTTCARSSRASRPRCASARRGACRGAARARRRRARRTGCPRSTARARPPWRGSPRRRA